MIASIASGVRSQDLVLASLIRTLIKSEKFSVRMNFEYNPLGDEFRERLEAFFGRRDHFIEVNPGRVVMPKAFADIGDSIRDLPIRSNDVWLMSFPRAGSTWAQEMVWLLGNNLDYEAARNQLQQVRTPLLELSAIFSDDRSVEDTVT